MYGDDIKYVVFSLPSQVVFVGGREKGNPPDERGRPRMKVEELLR